MNKLATTYLDVVDSLLAIEIKCPKSDGWVMIISNLADAVRVLNQSGPSESPLAQREKLLKPLTLDDLKRQVDAAVEQLDDFGKKNGFIPASALPDVLPLGDFEIRRRQ